jgi:mersacidin/lichenicidin family type 2 lantibiotic
MEMTNDKIVSSWKNEDYRLSLSSNEQALLPENPAGFIELGDEELLGVDGATSGVSLLTNLSQVLSFTITLNTCPLFCPPPADR